MRKVEILNFTIGRSQTKRCPTFFLHYWHSCLRKYGTGYLTLVFNVYVFGFMCACNM